jgi:hypothetical protein
MVLDLERTPLSPMVVSEGAAPHIKTIISRLIMLAVEGNHQPLSRQTRHALRDLWVKTRDRIAYKKKSLKLVSAAM